PSAPPTTTRASASRAASEALALQVAVEHRHELLGREEALAPLLVELRRRLRRDRLVERLALAHQPAHARGDVRQHVAVGLEIGLVPERTVAGNDLGVVVGEP